MTLKQKIISALQEYKNKRGIWRRLFTFFGFGYAPAIKKLRKLDLNEIDELRVLTCFIDNMPIESQASYKVYKDIFSFINIKEVTRCLKILHQTKLLTKENFNTLKEHNNPSKLAKALLLLEKANLLTPENFNVLKEHNNPSDLANALSSLKKAEILTPEYFNAVKEHNDPSDLANALSSLKKAEILTPEYFNVLKEHNNLFELLLALFMLAEANLLTPESFNAVKEHNNPSDLANALSSLKKADILTPESFNAVKEHNNPSDLANALSSLKKADILTPESFNAVKEHNNLFDLSRALSSLKKAEILTPENFNTVKEHNKLFDLSRALFLLAEARILTLENFSRLIHPQNNVLLTLRIGRMRETIWYCIPYYLLTQDVFEQLITRASLANPANEIERYINNLLGNGAGLNNKQNTHTASIHHSVSISATKLWACYSAELPEYKVEEIITIIKKSILNLPDNLPDTVNKAAKRCIERITELTYIFTDPVSKVTLRQLLALSYLVIHDDKKRQSSEEDAYKQFIYGLYEIQRGYNLSAEGVDDEQKDKPICISGTFNKLIEKFSGIHPDVELIFITKETAALKLPIIVREEFKNYLENLSKPKTKVGFHSFIKLLEQLLENFEIIWNKIKPIVADRLFDEFKSIYQDNKKNSDFLDLVDNGQYTEIRKDDLISVYQKQMVSSTGYRKYCSQILQNSKFFLLEEKNYLSNHHDNPVITKKI